jgi:Helicase conserved C-terminal domain
VRHIDDTTAAVTVALVNETPEGAVVRDLSALFQCSLSVSAGGDDVFVARPTIMAPGVDDQDLRSYELLYRHAKSFAVGHGCSAAWDGTNPDHKSAVRSAAVPMRPVGVAESNDEIASTAFSLKRVSEMPKVELLGALRDFCAEYAVWIEKLTADVPGLDARLGDTAHAHVDQCRAVHSRMLDGVALLDESSRALEAFRLMHDAMLEQRARTEWIRSDRVTELTRDERPAWRPFQLAFILLCLRGVANDGHPDRRIADLLWFPTGGGKTEAYLGLIAFTIFHRRLRGGHGGVTVLMRYTLRLLTIQQFARATLLICCCEKLRRERDDLGDDPISIGLWVGEAGTPNTRADAKRAVDRLSKGQTPTKGNPKQLSACSWCGSTLDSTHYWMGDYPPRLVVGCRRPDCEFNKGLPVFLVDDDIYDYRPSLVLATSDKFASMPWRDRCRDLFNLGSPEPPPELIVQDELHLISGPLGTLAGLYETAVDLLCRHEGASPKVIASTATIRRATGQTRALFDREMMQFPPSGLDARDSYFAVEAPPERRGDRLYVGLLAPAASHATLMIRVYARLLQSAKDVDAPREVRDAYWTLLGYFNSLRVLGGARMQVQDDVVDRLGLIARGREPRETDHGVIEMTSRIESGDIPKHLALMEKPLPDAIDVVLATNMISVGVDIDRLGLMVVMGQPQSTSEYIQATSRVGRRHPGLVAVLYNGARSRDRSHYEAFSGYHSALYRQVESTSVTPFSSRARDRALHAVLVAVSRLTIPALAGNQGAAAVGGSLPEVAAVRDAIVARVASASPEEADRTRAELDAVIEMWRARAADQPDLVYSDWERPTKSLLVETSKATDTSGAFATLFSLRDVDVESPLELVKR